jgi:hypothetical protein
MHEPSLPAARRHIRSESEEPLPMARRASEHRQLRLVPHGDKGRGELHQHCSTTMVERRRLLLPRGEEGWPHRRAPRRWERRRYRGRVSRVPAMARGVTREWLAAARGKGACYIRHSIVLQHKFLDVAKLYTCFNIWFPVFHQLTFYLA